jgi:hypothetical protein
MVLLIIQGLEFPGNIRRQNKNPACFLPARNAEIETARIGN